MISRITRTLIENESSFARSLCHSWATCSFNNYCARFHERIKSTSTCHSPASSTHIFESHSSNDLKWECTFYIIFLEKGQDIYARTDIYSLHHLFRRLIVVAPGQCIPWFVSEFHKAYTQKRPFSTQVWSICRSDRLPNYAYLKNEAI